MAAKRLKFSPCMSSPSLRSETNRNYVTQEKSAVENVNLYTSTTVQLQTVHLTDHRKTEGTRHA